MKPRIIRLGLDPIDLVNLEDDVACADTDHYFGQVTGRLTFLDLFSCRGMNGGAPVLGSLRELLTRTVERFVKPRRLHRLEQIVECTDAKCLNRKTVERSDEHDIGQFAPIQLRYHAEAVESRHADVEQQHVRTVFADGG